MPGNVVAVMGDDLLLAYRTRMTPGIHRMVTERYDEKIKCSYRQTA